MYSSLGNNVVANIFEGLVFPAPNWLISKAINQNWNNELRVYIIHEIYPALSHMKPAAFILILWISS